MRYAVHWQTPVGRKERGMSEPDYTIISSGGWELEEPTLGLRFLNGRLQQAWAIRSAAVSRVEWRDVPDATPQPGDEA